MTEIRVQIELTSNVEWSHWSSYWNGNLLVDRVICVESTEHDTTYRLAPGISFLERTFRGCLRG